jgi:hypothetical protein
VTLAVKPVLYYYSAMSLALAELLLKQTGDSSLDRAREQHRHHGLDFRFDGTIRGIESLEESCSMLRAAPLVRSTGEPFGTFALWHRSAREAPIAGTQRIYDDFAYARMRWTVLLTPRDTQLDRMERAGVSLLDCYLHLPHMRDFVLSHGLIHRTIRAIVKDEYNEARKQATITILVHPEQPELLDEFYSNITIEPRAIDLFRITELPSGVHIEIERRAGLPELDARIPAATVWNPEEVRFWPKSQSLNEFGFFYVALFIVGNLARYFPDVWLRELERSSPLALSVGELLIGVEDRMVVQSLSEMERTLLVVE